MTFSLPPAEAEALLALLNLTIDANLACLAELFEAAESDRVHRLVRLQLMFTTNQYSMIRNAVSSGLKNEQAQDFATERMNRVMKIEQVIKSKMARIIGNNSPLAEAS